MVDSVNGAAGLAGCLCADSLAHSCCGKGSRGAFLTAIFEQVPVTGSTNADLLLRADAGAPEGLWLRADQQTGGRGRQGRAWMSPLGNLYASTIIRAAATDPAPHTIAFVAGLAVYDTLENFAPETAFMLKWPNDILVDGSKIAGMLLERRGDAIIAGIGVNLAVAPKVAARKVTCLSDVSGARVQPQEFLEKLASHFSARLGQWRLGGIAPLLKNWQQHAHEMDTSVTVHLPDGSAMAGAYAGLADDGSLQLRLADGYIRAIHAGDVFLGEQG